MATTIGRARGYVYENDDDDSEEEEQELGNAERLDEENGRKTGKAGGKALKMFERSAECDSFAGLGI